MKIFSGIKEILVGKITLIENNELIDYIEIAFENDVDDIDREKGGENIIYYRRN